MPYALPLLGWNIWGESERYSSLPWVGMKKLGAPKAERVDPVTDAFCCWDFLRWARGENLDCTAVTGGMYVCAAIVIVLLWAAWFLVLLRLRVACSAEEVAMTYAFISYLTRIEK